MTLSAHWGALYNQHPPKLTSLFSFSLNSFRIPNFSNNAAETKSHKALNSKCNNCDNYHMTGSVPDWFHRYGTVEAGWEGEEECSELHQNQKTFPGDNFETFQAHRKNWIFFLNFHLLYFKIKKFIDDFYTISLSHWRIIKICLMIIILKN